MRTIASEGEFKLGLALALGDGNDVGHLVSFKWFTRCEWIRGKKHIWGNTPLFVVAADPDSPHQAYTSLESMADVCPVNVKLTKQCLEKGDQKKRPKLLKECVDMLRQWAIENDCHVPCACSSEESSSDDVDSASNDNSSH